MTAANSLPGKLLVVDHEPAVSQEIKRYLEHDHYDVQVVLESEQAINAVHNLRPDLILMSSNLPGKSSAEVCRSIKNDLTLGFVPIILLTSAESSDLTVGFEAGADDFLSKPIREPELRTHIRALMRLKKQYDMLWQQNLSLTDELAKRNHELEKALQEAKELSVLKDSIVRNVSHELKTPLLQVKSAVAMLAEDARASGKDGGKVLADHATAATARLESVVQNITQLAASLNVKSEPFRLIDAVNVATRQLGRQWASSGAVERIKTSVSEQMVARGDRGGVAQVLQQLLDNAIKFSPQGGAIQVSAEQSGSTLCISVIDHGIGIPDDQLERIFQAFYQVDNSPTRAFGGTGVGLAIVKLILDMMGTSISVKSTPGAGSTFSFSLPIASFEEMTLDPTRQTG